MDFLEKLFTINIFNDFLLIYLNEIEQLIFSVNAERVIDINVKYDAACIKDNSDDLINFENLRWNSIKTFSGETYYYYVWSGDAVYEQLITLDYILVNFLESVQDKFFIYAFFINFFFINFFFFKVTALNFWIIPQIILLFGGLITFIFIKNDSLNLKIWELAEKFLLVSFFYQLYLIYIYINFYNFGIMLKVGYSGLFKVPFNIFLIKLCSFLIIILILLSTIFFLKKFYFKTLYLIKPELCSLLLFLGFGSGMVFFQNDLFSIFLYLEIISFCIYGFLFLQQWTNSQLHGLIWYVLFSLWVASLYILGIALYLSWSNFNTNLSYCSFEHLNKYMFVDLTFENSKNYGYLNIELVFSIFFFLLYFLFKLGAVPFYTWVIEVYNSCSTGVLLAVSVLPKLIYFPILIFLLFFNFIIFYSYWSNLLFIFGLTTIFIGSMGILFTDKLKEIYSWSSIIHTGNILLILSCVSLSTITFCFFYIISYTAISFGFICIILSLRNKNTGWFIKTVIELSSINYLLSGFLIVSVIILASAAGFTPLLSFFMKFSLFSSISINYGILPAILVGVLNIIGSFAYLKMLWNMIGYNISSFKFKKTIKPYSSLKVSIDYKLGLFLNFLCIFICFGFFFYNEFLHFFNYDENFVCIDTLKHTQIVALFLYSE